MSAVRAAVRGLIVLATMILSTSCASSPRGATSGLVTLTAPPRQLETPSGVGERAIRVHRDAVVVDVHNDLPTRILDEAFDPSFRHPAGYGTADSGHTDVPRLAASGIDAQFLSAWPDAPYAFQTPDQSYARAVQEIETIHAFVRRHPEALMFATSAADVDRAIAANRVAVLIGVEGGHAIENSLEKLRDLHRRGTRYMTLTWNNGNDWAGAAAGLRGTRRGGLTEFGREVVREMNRLGMLVDISHVSDSTFWDVIATTSMPVIASHSSARALNDHSRNMTDDMLRAVARNGGVVNVNFFSLFIDPRYRSDAEAVDRRIAAMRDSARAGGDTAGMEARLQRARAELIARLTPTPLSVLIDHFDHIAKVAGVDHVGLGSDFDGVSALPQGMEDILALPRIAQALIDRGYSDEDVKKILGGNMMRVMRKAITR